MEKTTQGINPSTPRDYDKDPIVIEDYNPIFHLALIFVAGAVFLYIELVIGKQNSTMGFWAITFFPALFFYFYLRKVKRKVVIKTDTIIYHDNKQSLECIQINEIKEIERVFNDFYLKKQKMNPNWTIRIWLTRILSPIEYVILLMNKFIFHLVKNRLTAYKLFDAILIITEDKRVINILPTNKGEYAMVREYFFKKFGLDITTVKRSIIFDYTEEEKAK